jgi:hypothetical protein
MSNTRIAAVASMMIVVCWFPSLVSAQATRTWVSGVGDDVNPCSRTAPCKTYAGAMSKTAPSGEISTLDPGGFGGVTIPKSIVIDGTAGYGSIIASGVNGVVINAGPLDVVILRNIVINGVGTGLTGVRIVQAADVRIENCKITGFTQRGIDDRRTAGSLFVTNTFVSNNDQTGIVVGSVGPSSALKVHLDRVQMHGNVNAGFAITNAATATVVKSSATSNGSHGFYADVGSILNLTDSVASENPNSGVTSLTGGTVRLSNTTVTNNGSGLTVTPGSNILSYGNNSIAGNLSNNGPPTGTLPAQ